MLIFFLRGVFYDLIAVNRSKNIQYNDKKEIDMTVDTFAMLGTAVSGALALIVLFILGAIVQERHSNNKKHHDD